ncbi:MAG: hypothetical protein DSM106950_20870 [Stigonema ocellatum SAG 48.90 = DSM 106950]|nr:hypothetical protein [Stigonema ocellatum SAG 48.90 = DSM 106950]
MGAKSLLGREANFYTFVVDVGSPESDLWVGVHTRLFAWEYWRYVIAIFQCWKHNSEYHTINLPIYDRL